MIFRVIREVLDCAKGQDSRLLIAFGFPNRDEFCADFRSWTFIGEKKIRRQAIAIRHRSTFNALIESNFLG